MVLFSLVNFQQNNMVQEESIVGTAKLFGSVRVIMFGSCAVDGAGLTRRIGHMQ